MELLVGIILLLEGGTMHSYEINWVKVVDFLRLQRRDNIIKGFLRDVCVGKPKIWPMFSISYNCLSPISIEIMVSPNINKLPQGLSQTGHLQERM